MIPRLHVVTDGEILGRPDFHENARSVTEAGGDAMAFHLRGSGAGGTGSTGAALLAMARALQPIARSCGARLLVNDRVDVALALGLDGAHLGRRSLPVAAARAIIGSHRWIGRSVHDEDEAAGAERDGADFLFVGTIYPTPSHPGRSGSGPERLASVARQCGLPLIAIGGITAARVPDVREAGAHGVAVIRGIWNAPDPAEAVRQFRAALESG